MVIIAIRIAPTQSTSLHSEWQSRSSRCHCFCLYLPLPPLQVGLHSCRNVPSNRRSLFTRLPPHILEVRVQPQIDYYSSPKLEVHQR